MCIIFHVKTTYQDQFEVQPNHLSSEVVEQRHVLKRKERIANDRSLTT